MARKPSRTSASTWSFISEISGEITSTAPGRSRAGIWKVSDLPAPVGMTPMQSRPREHGVDDLALPGTELAVAEDRLEHLLRVVRRDVGEERGLAFHGVRLPGYGREGDRGHSVTQSYSPLALKAAQ